jgi:hypothetical protein
MGNALGSTHPTCVDFEYVLKRYAHATLISTIPCSHGKHRIKHTLGPEEEVEAINRYISSSENTEIIVYGMNCADTSVFKKYSQLSSLGFTNLKLYCGGLFEWILLQDVYGNDTFQTNHAVDDILKYK